jgi:hypothetical protein
MRVPLWDLDFRAVDEVYSCREGRTRLVAASRPLAPNLRQGSGVASRGLKKRVDPHSTPLQRERVDLRGIMDSYVILPIYNVIYANINTAPLEISAERHWKRSQRCLLRHLQLPSILRTSRNYPEDAMGRSTGSPMDMPKVALVLWQVRPWYGHIVFFLATRS